MKYNFTDGFSASSIDIEGMPYVGKVFDALMAQEVWLTVVQHSEISWAIVVMWQHNLKSVTTESGIVVSE